VKGSGLGNEDHSIKHQIPVLHVSYYYVYVGEEDYNYGKTMHIMFYFDFIKRDQE
jgi:hypothetical protein